MRKNHYVLIVNQLFQQNFDQFWSCPDAQVPICQPDNSLDAVIVQREKVTRKTNQLRHYFPHVTYNANENNFDKLLARVDNLSPSENHQGPC